MFRLCIDTTGLKYWCLSPAVFCAKVPVSIFYFILKYPGDADSKDAMPRLGVGDTATGYGGGVRGSVGGGARERPRRLVGSSTEIKATKFFIF